MKKHKDFIKSILIVVLSFVFFILIVLVHRKIVEYKKSIYKLETIFDTSDIITLDNKLPISDSLGKTYQEKKNADRIEGYSTFTIKNPNEEKITYEIYLTERFSEKNVINPNYIKLYLTDNSDKAYPGFDSNAVKSYGSLKTLLDKPGSRVLYKGTLVSGATASFKLRSWLSDSYVISNIDEEFTYDIGVRIK